MILKKLKIVEGSRSFGDDELDRLFQEPIDSFVINPGPSPFEDVVRYLNKMLSEIGDGSYSHVFKYKNRAIKIGRYQDFCWYHFGEYVMKHKNKHYPKIYRLKAFPDQGYYMAEMEILESVKYSMRYIEYEYPVAYELMVRRHDQVKVDAILREESQDSIVKAIKPFTKDKNCFLDLHDGNFMLRGKTLVLNDPIAPS